jgi:peptidoglycan hydrolase CwlO-like protein
MKAGGMNMDNRIGSSPAPRTAAEYRAAIDELLAEMIRMNEQMDRDRVEIERLKAETEVIKADTEVIKARLQSRLDALEARFS